MAMPSRHFPKALPCAATTPLRNGYEICSSRQARVRELETCRIIAGVAAEIRFLRGSDGTFVELVVKEHSPRRRMGIEEDRGPDEQPFFGRQWLLSFE